MNWLFTSTYIHATALQQMIPADRKTAYLTCGCSVSDDGCKCFAVAHNNRMISHSLCTCAEPNRAFYGLLASHQKSLKSTWEVSTDGGSSAL